MPQVRLDALEDVGAGFYIGGGGVRSVVAPSLWRIGGNVDISSNALVDLQLPALSEVGGTFTISSNNALTTLDLTGMTSLGGPTGAGNLSINSNPLLTSVALPNLAGSVQYIQLHYNTGLTTIDFRSLEQITTAGIHSISLYQSAVVPVVRLDNLWQTAGNLRFENGQFQEIYAPLLSSIGGTLGVTGNSLLSVLDLTSLTAVGGDPIQIAGNPQLCNELYVFPLQSRITGTHTWTISGNKSCP